MMCSRGSAKDTRAYGTRDPPRHKEVGLGSAQVQELIRGGCAP